MTAIEGNVVTWFSPDIVLGLGFGRADGAGCSDSISGKTGTGMVELGEAPVDKTSDRLRDLSSTIKNIYNITVSVR